MNDSKLILYIEKNGKEELFLDGIEIYTFKYSAPRMSFSPSLTATLLYPRCLDKEWSVGNVYTKFRGEKYFIKKVPTSSKHNDDVRYKHELIFEAHRSMLNSVLMFDATVGNYAEDTAVTYNTNFVFWADSIQQFADKVNASLAFSGLQEKSSSGAIISGYRVVVDDGVTSEGKSFSFENKYVSEALQEGFSQYKIPFYFEGEVIHFGFTENALNENFEYTPNGSLLSIIKNNTNNKTVNRCTGIGSTENIPYYYPNNSDKGQIGLDFGGSGKVNDSTIHIANYEKFAKNIKANEKVEYKHIISSKPTSLEIVTTWQTYDMYANVWSTHTKNFQGYTNDTDSENATLFANNYLYDYGTAYFNTKCEIKANFVVESGYGELAIKFFLADYLILINLDGSTAELPNSKSFIVEAKIKNKTTGFTYDTQYTIKEDLDFFGDDLGKWIELPIEKADVGEYEVSFEIPFSPSVGIYMQIYKGGAGWYRSTTKDKVELRNIGIYESSPVNAYEYGDYFEQIVLVDNIIPQQPHLMPSIYRETLGNDRFYNAENDKYVDENGNKYSFINIYSKHNPQEHLENFEDIKPTIEGVENKVGLRIDMFDAFAFDKDDNDEVEEKNGEVVYKHPYFFGRLRPLGFNLFMMASEMGELTVNMTTGQCASYAFTIGVMAGDGADSYGYNTVQVDDKGNLLYDENGNVKCGREHYQSEETPQAIQNNTTDNYVWIALKKDENAMGTLMPKKGLYEPKPCNPQQNDGDTFTLTNILLPEEYIRAAEKKLENKIIKFMSENNEEKFTYSIDFSRIYLEQHKELEQRLNENSRLKVTYNGQESLLYVTSYSYEKNGSDLLPKISVEVSETIEEIQNSLTTAIQNVVSDMKFDGATSGGSSSGNDFFTTGLKHFVRKDRDDEVKGQLTFDNTTKHKAPIELESGASIKSEAYIAGSNGFGVTRDDDGNWTLDVDIVNARKKFSTTTIETQKAYHIQGAQYKTSAAMACTNVVETENGYYCYMDIENIDDVYITNDFIVNDMAFCQTFNLSGENQRYWRLVTEVGRDYIVLSKYKCERGSTAPKAGDNIIQLGYQGVDHPERQVAVIDAGSGTGAPFYRQYIGINDFTLPTPETQLKPSENILSGVVNLQAGSTGVENAVNFAQNVNKAIVERNDIRYGADNLLLNTSFTGNYNYRELNVLDHIDGDTPMYSDNMEHWSSEGNAYADDEPLATKGKACVLEGGRIEQKVNGVKLGDVFTIRFKYKSDSLIKIAFCGFSDEIQGNDWEKEEVYVAKCTALTTNGYFVIDCMDGDAIVYDICLANGNVLLDKWIPAYLDKDATYAATQSADYIRSAIHEGSTSVLGGLILSNLIELGNYKNKEMTAVTSGLSGIYNSDNDVSFWGGGSFEQAIRTVQYYANNPTAIPTDEELKNMARAVITHGGRAILNDIILRGFVYAEGGVFRGYIQADSGVFSGLITTQRRIVTGKNVKEFTKHTTYLDAMKLGANVTFGNYVTFNEVIDGVPDLFPINDLGHHVYSIYLPSYYQDENGFHGIIGDKQLALSLVGQKIVYKNHNWGDGNHGGTITIESYNPSLENVKSSNYEVIDDTTKVYLLGRMMSVSRGGESEKFHRYGQTMFAECFITYDTKGYESVYWDIKVWDNQQANTGDWYDGAEIG